MREGFNQYAPMPGVLALRQALATKIERLYGRRYDPETEIAITTGATEGLYATLTALVHPGDEVVLFQPAYDSYTPAIQLSGGIPRYVTLRYPDYRIDWDEVRRTVTPRTRVIVLNTPHNPTGMVWTATTCARSRRCSRTPMPSSCRTRSTSTCGSTACVTRAWRGIRRSPSRAVVISSFGKTYHATGWKVGYCAAPAPLVTEILRVRQWVTFAVNGAVQMAYADAVAANPLCDDVTEFYQGRRDLFLRLIEGSRFRPLACRGTYFQMLDYSAITSEPDADVCDAARQRARRRGHSHLALPAARRGRRARCCASASPSATTRSSAPPNACGASRAGGRQVGQVGQVGKTLLAIAATVLVATTGRAGEAAAGSAEVLRGDARQSRALAERGNRLSPTSSAGASCTRTRSDASGAAPAPRSSRVSRSRTAASRAR